MTTFEAGSEDLAHNRIAAIESHHSKPDKEGELQVLLIEEYYASLPETWNIDPDTLDETFTHNNKAQLEAAKRWKEDGLASAFRKLMDEMKQNNDKDFAKVTLDMVKQYLD